MLLEYCSVKVTERKIHSLNCVCGTYEVISMTLGIPLRRVRIGTCIHVTKDLSYVTLATPAVIEKSIGTPLSRNDVKWMWVSALSSLVFAWRLYNAMCWPTVVTETTHVMVLAFFFISFHFILLFYYFCYILFFTLLIHFLDSIFSCFYFDIFVFVFAIFFKLNVIISQGSSAGVYFKVSFSYTGNSKID